MLFDNGGVIDNNTINSLISFNKIDYLKFLLRMELNLIMRILK